MSTGFNYVFAAMSLFSIPAFADIDCSKVDLRGDWKTGRQSSFSVTLDEKTQTLIGVDSNEIYDCWAPTKIRRVYIGIEFNPSTCVLKEVISKITRAELSKPHIESDESEHYEIQKPFYLKVLEYSASSTGRTMIVAPCADEACARVQYKDALTLTQ